MKQYYDDPIFGEELLDLSASHPKNDWRIFAVLFAVMAFT